MKRLLLADDHAMMLEAWRGMLSREYEIVGTASNGRDAVSKAVELQPDAMVLDVSMPELNGIEACKQVRSSVPSIKVVFCTQHIERIYIRAALDAGALGYVTKHSAGTELLEALSAVLQGKRYITPFAIPHLDSSALNGKFPLSNARIFGSQLTTRQREVLQLVAEGKSAKQIASALHISVKTVEFHRNALMDAVGMRTTAELTRYALTQGVIA